MKVRIGKSWVKKPIHKVEIEDHDMIDLFSRLAQVIHPALVKFKERRRGIPFSMYEPDTDFSKITDDQDKAAQDKYDAALDEMIFAFSEIANNNPGEEKFCTVRGEMVWGEPEPLGNIKVTELIDSGMDIDMEGLEAYNKRIENGLALFAKHYQSLWL